MRKYAVAGGKCKNLSWPFGGTTGDGEDGRLPASREKKKRNNLVSVRHVLMLLEELGVGKRFGTLGTRDGILTAGQECT